MRQKVFLEPLLRVLKYFSEGERTPYKLKRKPTTDAGIYRYVREALNRGLIEITRMETKRGLQVKWYRITQKGLDLLKILEEK